MSQQLTPETILSHCPFHTGELSSISPGAHGRAASTESRHSVEEQSIPPVKRKCTRDEDIMAAIPGIESVQPYPYFPLVGAAQASCSAIHVSIILGIYTCSREGLPDMVNSFCNRFACYLYIIISRLELSAIVQYSLHVNMKWSVKAICISMVSYEPTVCMYKCTYTSTRQTKLVNLCNTSFK